VSSVEIVDVGPRDGLQNAPVGLEPKQRAHLVAGLLAAGVGRVEAVSFVNPKRVPLMAGAEEVLAELDPEQVARCCGLVLNGAGYERLRATALQDMRFTVAVSNAFNERNSRASAVEGMAAAGAAIEAARAAGLRAGAVLATSFGCPFSGEVAAGRVLDFAEALVRAGASEIVFADTIGVAVPRQVRSILLPAAELGVPIGIHLHNTRGTGYSCAFAAYECGARIFDSSIGGLGGCPFAPGASGNIATEDLVYMFEREGISTGVDLAALLPLGAGLGRAGLPLDSGLQRAGDFPTAAPAAA
jgi:isopropylmalate/homocitrate/citramalate synthase